MPTRLDELIERVRAQAGDLPERDVLQGNLTSSATEVNLTEGEQVKPNILVCIELETMRVIDKPQPTRATVVRGYGGSTAAAHTAPLEMLVAPRFTTEQYREAINKALHAIEAAMGRPRWDTADSFERTVRILEVPADAVRVHTVAHKPTTRTDLRAVSFRFMRSVPTTISATGKGVRLTGYNPSTGTAYIGYEARWTALTALSGELDSEYPTDAEDLIEMGAVAYLADPEAFTRLAYQQPHTRDRTGVSEVSDVRLAAREALGRFLTRRSEVAALYHFQRTGWVKGL